VRAEIQHRSIGAYSNARMLVGILLFPVGGILAILSYLALFAVEFFIASEFASPFSPGSRGEWVLSTFLCSRLSP